MLDRQSALWWMTVAMLVVPSGGHAQWWVDLGMGRSSDEVVAPQLDTDNASLGFRYAGVNWLELTAGIPLGSSEGLWGSAAAGGRWLKGTSTAFGIAGTGQIFAQRAHDDADQGTGTVRGAFFEASPLVRFDAAWADVELRAGLIGVWNRLDDHEETWWAPSSWLVLERRLTDAANIQGTGRLVSVDGDPSAFLGITAAYDAPRWGAWGRAGHWFSDLERATEWSSGAYLLPAERLQLYASVHRDADDPVYGSTARLTWSIGASFALQPVARIGPEALPLELSSNRVLIRLARDEVEGPPSIAGDFNGWSPLPMQPVADGWEAHFDLAPGVYRFAFIDGNGSWFLPPSIVHRVDDGFGGQNGIVVVR